MYRFYRVVGFSLLCCLLSLGFGAFLDKAYAASTNQGRLFVAPVDIYAGHVIVGQSATMSCTVTNTGSASITITKATASNPAFRIVNFSLPRVLPAGKSAVLTVQFTPKTVAYVVASIVLTSNASNTNATAGLHGTGVPAGTLAAFPSPVYFGKVPLSNIKKLSVVLKNVGYSNVVISKQSLTGSPFSLSGLNLPLTLTPAQSVTFSATFSSTLIGVQHGNLSIASTATNGNLAIPIFGTGLPPGKLAASTIYFGKVPLGTSKRITAQMTAVGGNVNVTAASINNQQFSLSGTKFPITIPAGTTAAINLSFQPKLNGVTKTDMLLTSNASPSFTVQVFGTGVASHSVILSWRASASEVAGYNVYRGTQPGGPYQKVDADLATATSYLDSSPIEGSTYFYVVTAMGNDGLESAYSNEVRIVIPTS